MIGFRQVREYPCSCSIAAIVFQAALNHLESLLQRQIGALVSQFSQQSFDLTNAPFCAIDSSQSCFDRKAARGDLLEERARKLAASTGPMRIDPAPEITA